ncbi:NAD(P)/FAD-dependent oxidoreductase [Aquirufa ecclesiirivi]|uniref:NAD(P)/FAD-dependent oxidoreductase n=1 Tax=Aquirufa ecclesiirivi TaxID=2715124 RepID=UPI00140B941C|nr:FAD-dependent oxidoreductase [Aquirufa ecclesiirivi]NHC49731.1 FAD-dependent oxidoreductase [Aquirufa ecclesiirivi]
MPINKHTLPVLIVGQGLAGTILAHTLDQANVAFNIVDAPNTYFTSSYAAGGIFNPVTGRKLEKSWLVDELFSYLFPFYRTLEKTLDISFFHPTPLFRPFANEEMKGWLLDRKGAIHNEYLRWEEEGVWIKNAGWLDVECLLKSSKQYFQSKNLIKEIVINPNIDLTISGDEVHFQGQAYACVIFCEGFHAQKHNPFFGHLNFLPAKGELMKIKSEEPSQEYILNKNGFLLPLGNDVFKVGATYRWDDFSNQPSFSATLDLRNKLTSLGVNSYEEVEMSTGVRPATQDRRPLVGFHPQLPLAIFNGFGSKGVSLSPYFAQQWLAEWKGEGQINSEASIRRFYHLFST